MKYLLVICAVVFTLQNVKAQSYSLDKEVSSTKWVGYGEIGSFMQEGTIDLKNGQINIENGLVKSGLVTLDTKSIKHEDRKLSKHLKDKDFFDVRRYPEINFEISSTDIEQVYGRLTIKGVSHEEAFPYTIMEKDGLLTIEGIAHVDRTKYGIKYNSSAYFQDLGNYAIKNIVDLRFKLVFRKSD